LANRLVLRRLAHKALRESGQETAVAGSRMTARWSAGSGCTPNPFRQHLREMVIPRCSQQCCSTCRGR